MGTDRSDDSRSNPFDQIRNTCQNLFTTFTDKIAAGELFKNKTILKFSTKNSFVFFLDFNFDFKQNPNERQPNVCEDQPRYSNNFRNRTSFGSNGSSTNDGNRRYQRPTTMTSNENPPTIIPNHSASTPTTSNSSSVSTPSQFQSPKSSTIDAATFNENKSPSNLPSGSATVRPKLQCNKLAELSRLQTECCSENGSGCECSDDELIMRFREKYCEKDNTLSPVDSDKTAEQILSKIEQNPTTNPTSSSSSSTKAKDDGSAIESSDISSFEDLGAVGGIPAITEHSTDIDKWQIVNNPWTIDDAASTSSIVTDDKTEIINNIQTDNNTTNLPNSIIESPQLNVNSNQRHDQQQLTDMINDESFQLHSTSQTTNEIKSKLEKQLKTRNTHRKITRRQSDGIVYTATTSNVNRKLCRGNFLDELDIDDDDNDNDDDDYSSNSEDMSQKRSRKSCHKCGKTKGDLKKYIERFRHQLETTTDFSETEIKRQLDAFLEFLENHSRNSFDSKDDDTIVQNANMTTAMVQSPTQLIAEAIELDGIEIDDFDDYDDEAGIHVYGSNDDTASSHPPRQFFDLNTIAKKYENSLKFGFHFIFFFEFH